MYLDSCVIYYKQQRCINGDQVKWLARAHLALELLYHCKFFIYENLLLRWQNKIEHKTI